MFWLAAPLVHVPFHHRFWPPSQTCIARVSNGKRLTGRTSFPKIPMKNLFARIVFETVSK
jgi:hypothetical protein